MKSKCLLLVLGLGLGLILVFLWWLSTASTPVTAAYVCRPQAPGDVITVCLSGGCDYSSIQAAVDAADDGDVIKVAAGTYTDVHQRTGITQVVYISKTVTVRGGYTTTNWSVSNPILYPTTLDAGGLGRVLVITGTITPMVEGLRVTGGNATGLGGGAWRGDAGGGIYVYTATATISDCVVYSNTATSTDDGYGGGLYLLCSDATLSGNTVQGNTSNTRFVGHGGGLSLHYSNAALSDNTIVSNTASTDRGDGWGGGLYLLYSDAVLTDNTVQGNTASTGHDAWGDGGRGGGLYLYASPATLIGNTVQGNTASTADDGQGGGIYLSASPATLTSNVVQGNTACGTEYGLGKGGGLYLYHLSDATLSGNTVQSNTANTAADGFGGGLYLHYSDATLNGNTIQRNAAGTDYAGRGGGLYLHYSDAILSGNAVVSNTAALNATAIGYGGGLWLYSSSFTMTNNLVADNHANYGGGGFWLENSYGRLLHITIADSRGSGQGVFAGGGLVGGNSTLVFTNTIIDGHDGAGISVATGSTATLEATLWYDNGANTSGEGTIMTGTVNVYDDPAFVSPSAWDYHIGAGSAAIDQGVNAGVSVDIDGDSRPDGCLFDIGADEFITGVECKHIYLPLVLRNH